MKSDAIPHNAYAVRPQKLDSTSSQGAVSAELLFGGAKEIVIRHQGYDYRLRITRNDKLILTK